MIVIVEINHGYNGSQEPGQRCSILQTSDKVTEFNIIIIYNCLLNLSSEVRKIQN